MRMAAGAGVLLLTVVAVVALGAQQSAPQSGAADVLPWAYIINDPVPPSAASAPRPDPNEVLHVPGSKLAFKRSDIAITNGPPDWHPEGHPPMPPVVAKGAPGGVSACGYCHLPNGQGKPENASVAGHSYEYIVQQMRDYKAGRRKTGEPRMGPPALMERIGAATSDQQVDEAARYFSSITYKPWIRVVESTTVPKSRRAGWIHQLIEGGGQEPLGLRIVETPEHLEGFELRDDAVSMVAYVPKGAVAKGRALATTGGNRKTSVCGTCHGADLKGLGPVPALAGRSPSYMARQLYDFKQGTRNGTWSDLMDGAVKNLTVEDIVNLVSYTASLKP